MFYRYFFALIVLFTLWVTQSIYSPELLYGDSLVLRWNINDEEDLGGYNIYCTGPEADYDSNKNLGSVTECDLGTLSLQENVPFSLALTAYDIYGNESDFSEQLHLTLDDEIDDFEDNCPDIYNPYQEDDYPPGGNGIGDACEDVPTSSPITTASLPECRRDSDCDDAIFCNGNETCSRGRCRSSETPCAEGETCDEENDQCLGPCSISLIPGISEVVSGQSLKFYLHTEGDCRNATYEWSIESPIGSSCDQDGNYVSGINRNFFTQTTDVVKVVELNSGSADQSKLLVSWQCFLLRLYGEDSEEVGIFRRFRNHFIDSSPEGEAIIRFYYKWSPLLVKAIEKDEELEEQLREVVDTLLFLTEEKID
jgi:hypothetical protein